MATIPMGNFGQAVARPGPAANVFGGDPVGQALDHAGQVGMQIANDAAQQNTRLEQERQRAQAALTLAKTRNDIRDASREVERGVLDGSIAPDKASADFRGRVSKIQGANLDGYLPDQRMTMEAHLTGFAGDLDTGIGKVAQHRQQLDTAGFIDQFGEQVSREAMHEGPAWAVQKYGSMVDFSGGAAGLNPQQQAKMKQSFAERVHATFFESAGNAALQNGDAKALGSLIDRVAGPDGETLDPKARTELSNKLYGWQQHLEQKAELAAQRIQREADRRLHQAEAAFNVFQTMADKGTVLDPSYVEQVSALTAGTPYQAGVRMLAQQARETGGLAARPLAEQAAILMQIDQQIAAGGRSPGLDKRREQVSRVVEAARRDADADPMAAALERGVITQIAPFNPAGLQGLVQTITQRRDDAQRVSMWRGTPSSPFTAREADMISEQLGALPPKEQSVMISSLTSAMGSSMAQAFAQQVSPKNADFGAAVSLAGETTSVGRITAELALRGIQAKRDGTSTKGSKQPELKVANWQAAVSEYLGDAYPPKVADQVRGAAVLIAHGIASEQGGELSKADLERAARLAIGGDVVEHNGRRVPVPAGFSADDLARRMRSLKPADIGADTVLAGGRQMSAAEFAGLAADAPLMPISKGRYTPLIAGRPALLPNGQPVVIGVR